VRFIDDTFTVKKKRVRDICEGILREKIRLRWSCLSRVDTLDEETLRLMKKAGCRRIYIGIESYSQRVTDYFRKGYRCESINDSVAVIKKAGLESVGFIIVGSPFEDRDDFRRTLEGVLMSSLDFVIVTKLVPYPGTPLFDKERHRIRFTLFPYESSFNGALPEDEMIRLEREVYRRFYFRPVQIWRLMRVFMRTPILSMQVFISFMRFLMTSGEKEHPDFL